MYKLILVDDEEEVRNGIIQKIDWEKHGFEIIGDVENGREALDLIEKSIPDVVITDIKMPIMNGLELSSCIKENYPLIKIVILTGFDEFTYAQQAINCSVVEYVLKPVLQKDITDLLDKLKDQLDKETTQKESIKQLREHYIQSLPLLRDKFLISLITRKIKKSEIEKKIAAFNLKLDGKGYIAAVVNIDNNSINRIRYSEDDIELLKFSVMNISEEIVSKRSLGELFFHINNIVIITSHGDFDRENIYRKTFLALEEIRQCVEKYLKLTVTAGIGTICNDIDNLPDSFKSAITALDYRLVIGNNKVIYIEDLEPQSTEINLFDENKEKTLITALKFGTEKEIIEINELLFKDIRDIKASLKDYQIYLLEILASIVKVAKSLQFDMRDVLGINDNLFVELYQFNTMEEVKEWLEGICIKLMKYISCKRQDNCKLLLEKAKNYIKSNYSDPEIGINKVSNFLHISPCYLSLIFKKETGETFLNYLISIRLEVAKELLRSTNLKTFEIAEKIGYSDPNYFSYFFKKNFGNSPREYRNNCNR